jgi:hypothetical protein
MIEKLHKGYQFLASCPFRLILGLRVEFYVLVRCNMCLIEHKNHSIDVLKYESLKIDLKIMFCLYCTMMGYMLDGQSLIPGRGSVQTGFGAHPASYSMGTGDSFPGGKVAVA